METSINYKKLKSESQAVDEGVPEEFLTTQGTPDPVKSPNQSTFS